MRNWFFLTAMFLAVGCEQTQTTGSCTSGEPFDGGAPLPIIGGDGGTGGEGGQAPVEPLQGGAPCDVDAQCASSYCVASKNDWSFGYCYGDVMDGCIVVTEPSPFKAQCAASTKILYVCGTGFDVSQLGTCDDVATGMLSEHYQCCAKP